MSDHNPFRFPADERSASACREAVAVLSEQVLGYLDKSGCCNQSREALRGFMEAVQPFELTHMEMLALANTPPASIVEVHLLVEECEERLSPERVLDLLRICRTLLPKAEEEAGE